MKTAEDTARSRKRSRTSNDADNGAATFGGKKARGRPRVDTQDATAADRRRTQIRLAQRAYRQRKESTISSLKRQSSQLHALIDQMNSAFIRFNESAIKSGLPYLNPELAREFKQVVDTFTYCVKTANERALDSDEEEYGETIPEQEAQSVVASAARRQSQPSQAITPPETEQPWGYAVTSQTTVQSRPQIDATQPQSYLSHISSSSYDLPESINRSSLVRRGHFTVRELLDQSRSMQAIDDQSRQHQQQQQEEENNDNEKQHQPLPFGLVDLPSREQSPFVPPYIFPVNIPAMGAELPPAPRRPPTPTLASPLTPLSTKTVSLVYTYSHDEVTFARRLTRATLEAAFKLLSSNVLCEKMFSVFKLSMSYLTLEEIRIRFKTILSRGINDDLDWFTIPFFHIGGAGTHYQRRDAEGNAIPMKNSWTVRQIEPLDRHLVRVENVANGQTRDLEGIDLSGFDGEWFDAYDVQCYLEEQWHCRINSKSSFAECLVEDEYDRALDNVSGGLSRRNGSTSATDTSITPPIPRALSAFGSTYGLDMPPQNVSAPSFLQTPPKQSFLDLSLDQTLGLDLAPVYNMGFAGSIGYSGLNMMGETEDLPFVKQKQKKVAWVDVTKLIDKMIKHAVCLGRAPGYRRRDVDVAFREALIPTN